MHCTVVAVVTYWPRLSRKRSTMRHYLSTCHVAGPKSADVKSDEPASSSASIEKAIPQHRRRVTTLWQLCSH